jgi:uncharacterized membrane protein
MKLVATALGILIGVVGLAGIASPSTLLEFGRSLQTPAALYAVAAVRLAFGAVLVWVAPVSRTPKTLRVIGIFIILAALVALFVGVEHTQALLDWWSSQGLSFQRVWAGVAVLFGLFVVHTVNRPRGAGH